MTREREPMTLPPRIAVVVADAARARLFEAARANGQLTETAVFVNPDARLHERQITSDLAGRMADGARRGQHAVSMRTSAHREAIDAFARRLCQHLRTARRSGEFGRLYLVADPELLGLLRRHLDAVTRRCVAGEVGKSVVKRSLRTIRQALPARL